MRITFNDTVYEIARGMFGLHIYHGCEEIKVDDRLDTIADCVREIEYLEDAECEGLNIQT